MLAHTKIIALIAGLALLSGFADSQGFIHAALIWQDTKLLWSEVAKSALGFATGIMLYWITLRYLTVYVAAPELQTIIWFGVTIVGVAVVSGRFAQWRITEQLVAVGVLFGISWLLVRTAS